MNFLKRILSVLVLAGVIFGAWHYFEERQPYKYEALLKTDQDAEVMQSILDLYNEGKSPIKIRLYDPNDEKNQRLPDLYISEYSKLIDLEQNDKLVSFDLAETDNLPNALKCEHGKWYGLWYDPVVFLINQHFTRVVGQDNIRGWSDVLRHPDIKVALEDFSNNDSTFNIAAAFAERFGEILALEYAEKLHQNVIQYSKYPVSSIRLVVVGDADVAITRESHVAQYLDNSFPAYVYMPTEGTPIDLFAIGIDVESEHFDAVKDFSKWLYSSDDVIRILLEHNTGYRRLNEKDVKLDDLWLNTSYLTSEAKDALLDKWLNKVRFAN